MKELTKEQNVKYSVAIKRGYFKNYSVLWRTTCFDGIWLWNYPNRVKSFERFKEICGHTPTWDDITDTRLRIFVEILLENVCNNSARTICAELKSILNSYGIENNIPSRNFDKILTVHSDASEAVYLTRKELERVREYKPSSELEKAVVGIFMIEALTGARHVDSERLTMNNVNSETNTIHYTMKKTRKSVMVPFHNWLVDYLPKDAEELSKRPNVCLMSFNRALRRICQSCNINTSVTLYRRGKEYTGPKYKFISSHTARRSFATNLHLWGTEISLVCQLMGHSDTKITLGYIKENSAIPAKVQAFFNG